jgi:hypothetical protein
MLVYQCYVPTYIIYSIKLLINIAHMSKPLNARTQMLAPHIANYQLLHLHSSLPNVMHVATKSARGIKEVYNVNMNAW